MSAHVVDRLSAFLDRELTEAEASGVRQHLADCEACADRLREMEGADHAFAAVPADAPPGYFDSFAARVRGRIEAAPVTIRPATGPSATRMGLPAWSWAVAAAILLGMLLPRLPWDGERPRSRAEREGPATAQRAAQTPGFEADVPVPPSSAPPATLPPSERALHRAAPAAGSVPAQSRIPVDDPRDAMARDAFAGAGLDDTMANEAIVARPSGAAPTHLARSTPAPEAPRRTIRPPEPGPGPPAPAKPQAKKDSGTEVAGRTSGEAMGAPVADAQLRMREEGASAAPPVAGELRSAILETSEAEAAPPAAPAPGTVALGRATEAKRRGAPSAVSATGQDAPTAKRSGAEVEFEALATRRAAQSLEDLVRLRTAWRSFLSRHPEGPRADEARVAVIAVSVEIAVLSRTPEDDAEARRSGETYLAREDAAQKGRVQTLLARLPGNR